MADPTPAIWPVAIAGGGFSGTMLAAQLATLGVRSLIADGSGRIGRGLAYATQAPEHLLNVPAAKMSAWPDRPAHFAEWLAAEGLGDPATFARRRDYGRYVAAQLDACADIERVEQDIVSATRTGNGNGNGWAIRFADGRTEQARVLVLAQGNQPPAPLAIAAALPDALIVNDPWSDTARATFARVAAGGGAVLMLGTGLTMIDVALSLAAAGHSGPLLAMSRRGLAPRAHGPNTPRTVAADAIPLGNVLELTRWLRVQAAADGDWRAAVDQLRPHTQAIWRSWDLAQRRRFLRHARPYWDVHRHRIAPQIAAQVEALREADQLHSFAGRLLRAEPQGDSVAITIADRGGARRTLTVAAIVNCTGPLGDITRTRDPLLAALLAAGEVQPDALSLGLAVDPAGRAAPGLWALGPQTKGELWEIVAVPDIRVQCAAIARTLAHALEPA